MDTIGGLVAHPLLVHAPVVLVPLAAIGAVAMAVRPAWFRHFGPVVTVIAGVGAVFAVLATRSGEALEDRYVRSGQTISGTLEDHVELGERVPVIAILFFVLMLLWVMFGRWRRGAEVAADATTKKPTAWVAAAFAAAVVLAGAGASVVVLTAGHSGAESVWENVGP
jgi:uncharacterized membrane protein